MPTSTVENYVKQIFLESDRLQGGPVAMGRISELLGVVPGTATAMVKSLADSGLVLYEPRVGVELTPSGRQLALHMLRRHRLVEVFLVNTLGYSWSEIHADAEKLEHAISDKLLERLDRFLGHPRFDPHGDPIPDSAGSMAGRQEYSLTVCPIGGVRRVSRVVDQEPAFLDYVMRQGLAPGAELTILEHDPVGEVVVIGLAGGRTLHLGTRLAHKIRVE